MAGPDAAQADKTDVPRDGAVEECTRQFYDTVGWVTDDQGVIGEDRHFRAFGDAHAAYGAKVDAKPRALLEGFGGTVLFAGPGDLPASHQAVAGLFDHVVCADISQRSLDLCREKLGDKVESHLTSLLDLPFEDGSLDAALCAHVLYHIDKQEQRKAISELIRVTRPGGRIVVVYCNPKAPFMRIQLALKALGINRLLGKNKLYTHYYPLDWWQQFAEGNRIDILPHDAISANQAKALLPTGGLQRRFFGWAGRFEDRHPRLARALWSYVAVTIDRVA